MVVLGGASQCLKHGVKAYCKAWCLSVDSCNTKCEALLVFINAILLDTWDCTKCEYLSNPILKTQ
jgi:hypothetical protein